MRDKRHTIRLVDGFKIRNTLDVDFTVFHYPSSIATYFAPKFYIPENEGWLDHRFKDEQDFLVRLEEMEIPNLITTYSAQRAYLTRQLCTPGPVPPFEVSRRTEDGCAIVMVDGRIVRTYVDPEFVFGGHRCVYDYVPEGEIWLDALMDPKEVPYVLLHEKTEYELMKRGKSYDVAHEYANATEKERRRTDGVGVYPGDDFHPWWGLTNEQLAQYYYVD